MPVSPSDDPITNCHCGRCHCGFSPERTPVYSLGCCNGEHRAKAVKQWQSFAHEQHDTIMAQIKALATLHQHVAALQQENERLRTSLRELGTMGTGTDSRTAPTAGE